MRPKEIEPLILFSLPRSGSTLTQRILASHRHISTVSEPWLLLPYLYTLKKDGTHTEYGYFMLVEAIEDLCRKMPNGKTDYLESMRDFVIQIYAKLSHGDSLYFLDKTPRYHLITDEIFQLFPNGKFIFLWRHPLAIAASIIETWADGKWNLFRYHIDLYDGLANLISAYQKHQDVSYALRYEDLLLKRDQELEKLLGYLELSSDSNCFLDTTPTALDGRWGNPPKAKRYKSLSSEPLEKWKIILANPLRKAWCRRYLEWIGKERLAIMGYSLQDLLEELNSIPISFHMLQSDVVRMPYGSLPKLRIG